MVVNTTDVILVNCKNLTIMKHKIMVKEKTDKTNTITQSTNETKEKMDI